MLGKHIAVGKAIRTAAEKQIPEESPSLEEDRRKRKRTSRGSGGGGGLGGTGETAEGTEEESAAAVKVGILMAAVIRKLRVMDL